MTPQAHDGTIGLVTLLCIGSFVFYLCGPLAVLGFLYLCVLAMLMGALWSAAFPMGKIVCIVALPPILLVYCLPKTLRHAVNALPAASAP
ncbi:hypothetical protein IV454_06155 [Massilia antarctica]|uniref:Transmembrane protein n=1 Tax=Massilia antarctica TaxID=2765360 RepID=A0AA48WGE2_9BURK|nr:hypothetical protein [Massilia antarctica]QPI51112.1 hypothetical protein IV454_06155 [Massilia antarctica]